MSKKAKKTKKKSLSPSEVQESIIKSLDNDLKAKLPVVTMSEIPSKDPEPEENLRKRVNPPVDHSSPPPVDPVKSLLEVLGKSEEKEPRFDLKQFSDAFSKIISKLSQTETDDLTKMSDLSDKSINSLSIIQALTNYYDFPSLREYLQSYLRFRISLDRKGRDELMRIAVVLQQLHQTEIISENMVNNPYAFNMVGQGGMQPQQSNNMVLQEKKRKRRFGLF